MEQKIGGFTGWQINESEDFLGRAIDLYRLKFKSSAPDFSQYIIGTIVPVMGVPTIGKVAKCYPKILPDFSGKC